MFSSWYRGEPARGKTQQTLNTSLVLSQNIIQLLHVVAAEKFSPSVGYQLLGGQHEVTLSEHAPEYFFYSIRKGIDHLADIVEWI
jgi:hypothetical protein